MFTIEQSVIASRFFIPFSFHRKKRKQTDGKAYRYTYTPNAETPLIGIGRLTRARPPPVAALQRK